MQSDKYRLFLITVLTFTVLLGAGLYGFMMISNEEVNLGNTISLLIPLIIVVFMAFFIVRRYKDVKQGMPLEDERSKRVITNAAARSFYFSLYWLLAISFFESFFAKKLFGVERLDASQTVGGAIAGMAIFFLISWIYFDRKGRLA